MNVLDYLSHSAKEFPDKTAFADTVRSVTYAQLDEISDRIASALLEKNYQHNMPVAVLIERNIESICTFFGIVKSRCFYVPVDITQPQNRIRTIMSQMNPVAVISAAGEQKDIGYSDADYFAYEELAAHSVNRNMLDECQRRAMDTDPLYAICTSGSTGTPKGVLISHRSVMDFIPVFTETFGLTENDVFGNQAPFDFDVSVKDVYSTVYCGATMHIIPRTCFSMPKKLVEFLDVNKVTTIIWAVSAMCIAAGFNAFKHCIPGALNKIMFSGEVMPVKMLNIWRNVYPDALFVNLYGPTEITCNCMYYILDRTFDNTEKLPLGIPFKNESVLFLNEDNMEIKTGETGEICVCGTCLALGYYGDPERTAAAFVQNPLNDRYPELMYRTGDLAELREDGQYYFAARKDFQIKHMGHRIELEEIETHMNAVDGVLRACCIFDDVRNKIVACYAGDIEKMQIINQLKDNLPKYMIPNIFIQMDQLPLNKNGKIDRTELRKQYEEMK